MDKISDQIKSRLDIIEVIQEYLPELKQAGINWKALCPFHQEKTPSFYISPEKQIWHCFGCGKGGSIFSFVMEIEGIEFKDALRILAKKAGIALKKEDPQLQTRRNRLIEINQQAALFFHQILIKSPKAEKTRQYLKNRKISSQTAKEFQLGYALDDWRSLIAFLKNKGYQEKEIVESGLAIVKDQKSRFTNPRANIKDQNTKTNYQRLTNNQIYDRFRNRLMFPILNHYGEIVGFSGRILEPNQEPKYINTPQTLIYNKSQILYGLDKAKQSIRKEKLGIIVEGNIDVLISHQAGIKNVVASGGTALTLEQIRLLKRYSHSLALAFDEDTAGQEAAKRGINLARQEEIQVKIIRLDQGKDPDELIKKDPQLWQQAIKKAKKIIDFYFDQSLKDKNLTNLSLEDKKEISQELLPEIKKIKDRIEQAHYLQKLENILNVPEKVLREEMLRLYSNKETANRIHNKKTVDRISPEKEEEIYAWPLFLALRFPQKIEFFLKNLEEDYFLSPNYQALYKNLKKFYDKKKKSFISSNFRKFLKKEDKKLASFFDLLEINQERDFEKKNREIFLDQSWLQKEIEFSLKRIKTFFYKKKLKEKEFEIKKAEKEKKDQKLKKLLEEFKEISSKIYG